MTKTLYVISLLHLICVQAHCTNYFLIKSYVIQTDIQKSCNAPFINTLTIVLYILRSFNNRTTTIFNVLVRISKRIRVQNIFSCYARGTTYYIILLVYTNVYYVFRCELFGKFELTFVILRGWIFRRFG